MKEVAHCDLSGLNMQGAHHLRIVFVILWSPKEYREILPHLLTIDIELANLIDREERRDKGRAGREKRKRVGQKREDERRGA